MLSRRDVLRLLLLSLCLGSAWPQLFEDTPAFAESAIVARERGSFEALCVDSCGWGPALSAQQAHYRDLDRVFVLDWGGMGMNGLGNSLIHFLRPLAAGALADRASFSRRNAAGCADSAGGCRMDPGAFVGTRRGAAWAWTEELAAALRARGAEEATLRFDNASVGFVLRRGSGQETACLACPTCTACCCTRQSRRFRGCASRGPARLATCRPSTRSGRRRQSPASPGGRASCPGIWWSAPWRHRR